MVHLRYILHLFLVLLTSIHLCMHVCVGVCHVMSRHVMFVWIYCIRMYVCIYVCVYSYLYIYIYIISYISRLYMEVLNFATQLHPESSQLWYMFGIPTRLEALQLKHPSDTHCGTSRLVVLQDGLTELAETIASTVGMRVGHATCGCARSPRRIAMVLICLFWWCAHQIYRSLTNENIHIFNYLSKP